jgi:cell fate regulator YaaT (PSP1 superfamily)
MNEEMTNQTTTVVGISFKSGGKVYFFDPQDMQFCVGDHVIVSTARGDEYGYVVQANKAVNTSDLVLPLRQVLRMVTREDIARHERNQKIEEEAMQVFPKKAAQHGLEMKLVDVECAFDNSKLIFYFTAEGRVDFRELVKDLASVFRTRIDLRQIGIRDEAKMLGGIGSCGRPFCCSTFLTDFGQVSIKMAKEQNFSLNSAKISGCCGRLMCCLRYEHEVYEEAQKTMPRIGAAVMTDQGPGVVVETRPLTQTVKVKLDDKQEAPRVFECSQITPIRRSKKGNVPDTTEEEEG